MTGGPISLTADSVARLRPVRIELDGGFWGQRQHLNRDRSIPYGLDQLRRYGQWDNLRHAADRATGDVHNGRPYHDSDVYKMAEALAWTGADPAGELTAIAKLVRSAQDDSGYVNSWFQCTGTPHFSDLQLGHEMYCAGHLIQAAIAADRTIAGTGLLAAAVAFADHLVDTFGSGDGICGHPQIETALVELYRQTGRDRYLALAEQMVDRRGHGRLGPGRRGSAYYQDNIPVREASELDGHCVRALYLAAGATDVYLETGDATLLSALLRQWDDTVATKTYLTGGVGCRRKTEAFGAAYELPPDQAFNETCAGVANVMWAWRLLLSTGQARFADQIERVLFNVVAAGVSLTGDGFSYINTLHRRATAMEVGDKAPYRQAWFGCPCCPPNLMRLLASLGHYMATTDASGVQLHQYAGGRVRTPGMALDVRCDYPHAGEIGIHVTAAGPDESTLQLRLPAWCREWTVEVNHRAVTPPVSAHGYLLLRRRWQPGDRVDLHLAMPARFTMPHRRIDAVRGCVAIERGPLVYCFEDADLPAGVSVEDLTLDPSKPARPMARPDLLDGVTTIEVSARVGSDRAEVPWPYPGYDQLTAPDPVRELTVTAIPYHAWDNRSRGVMRVWLPTVHER